MYAEGGQQFTFPTIRFSFKSRTVASSPLAHVWCLLTQVKYTQGGLENMELSRKYFAQALRLNNRNMRALFGLYMVSLSCMRKKRSQQKLFCNHVVCQGWGWPQCKLNKTGLCMCFFEGRWGGGSQKGQLTADSESGLQLRKSVCLELLIFRNVIRFYHFC